MFKKLSIIILIINIFTSIFCQKIDKEVVVIKSYQPSLSEASKINLMPVFGDTLIYKPNFKYSITPLNIKPIYQPRPVTAARVTPEIPDNLSKTYLKLGLGNHFTPLAELSINSLRSKENSYGIYAHHYSSNSTIKHINGKDAVSDFTDNQAKLYGMYFTPKTVLSGDIDFSNNNVMPFGVKADTIITLKKEDYYHKYYLPKASFSIESNETDSSKLYYKLNGLYGFISDNQQFGEHNILMQGIISKTYESYYLMLSTDFDTYKPINKQDSLHNNIFSIKPILSKSSDEWRFHIGFQTTIDNNALKTKVYFFPSAQLTINIAPKILTGYVSINGKLDANHSEKLSKENPYILPGLQARNTNKRMILTGGLKGTITSNAAFNLNCSYSAIDNQYFFVNDSSNLLGNYFNTFYDNIELLAVNGDISIRSGKHLSIDSRATYRKYTMSKLAKPWHIPLFEANITAKYNMQNKIIAQTDIFFIGERNAFDFQHKKAFIVLNPFVDINLGTTYRYTKYLSIYLQFKNLLASKYEAWNQYPAYRFQFMAGITYDL